MSALTAQDIVEAQAALGITARELSAALGKHAATVSSYKSGRQPIPQEVAIKLAELLQHESQRIATMTNKVTSALSVGELITFQNTRNKRTTHVTEGRFMRRQATNKSTTLPAYRMTKRQFDVYVHALRSWQTEVRELARQHGDANRQRDYALELADIKAMAAIAPRAMPYDVVIESREWDVVSRALRHHSKTDPYAFSFYQTWRKNRGAGSYLNYRAKIIEQRLTKSSAIRES